jgi:hypothetical protein
MTTATLTHSRIQKNSYAKTKTVELPQINWGIICTIGATVCTLLLFFYIYQINVLTKGTYLISSYKNSIEEISKENKKLEVNFAENSFLGEVLTKTQELNFEKTTAVKYIQVLESSLAKAK